MEPDDKEIPKEDTLSGIIKDEIRLLHQWASQSESGGWSTHQVEPMRRRAANLTEALVKLGKF